MADDRDMAEMMRRMLAMASARGMNAPGGLADMMRSMLSANAGMPADMAEVAARQRANADGTPSLSGPLKKEEQTELEKKVATLSESSASTEAKVQLLMELNQQCGFGDLQREWVAAGGITKAVEIATADWPADGDLGRSGCAYDVVVKVKDVLSPITHQEEFGEAVLREEPPSSARRDAHLSMRRAAIACLADMSNYRLLLEKMIDEGLFTSQKLARMLEHMLKRYNYGQEFRKMYDALDQTQPIAERLACLAANGMIVPQLQRFLAEECAVTMTRYYITPKEVAVNRRQAARERRKADRAAQGLPEEPKDLFSIDSDDDEEPRDTERGIAGTLIYQWSRFMSNVIMHASTPQIEALIDEGIVSKLRSSMEGNYMGAGSVAAAISVIEPHFNRVSRQKAAAARAEIQEQEKESMELRLKGNAAFKEEKWQEAIDCYTEALTLNWEDVALWNNRSLAYIKLDQYKKALGDAHCALFVEPANPKAWARMGDCYKHLRKKQLAQLVYMQAVELVPNDDQYSERLKEALTQVPKPWAIDKIPSMTEDYIKYREWVKLPPPVMKPGGRGRRAVPDMEAEEKAMEKVCGTERCIAAQRIKSSVAAARVAARCGALTKSSERAKTAQLIRELPCRGSWCVSWSDTPLRQKSTKLIRYTISIADQMTGMHVYNGMATGEPKAKVLLMALRQACLQPLTGGQNRVTPYRPKDVLVAARILPWFDVIADELARWGVNAVLEAYEDAVLTCRDHDTDPDGMNFRGHHIDAEDDEM